MAETFTEKLKLSKRDTGDLNWGQSANSNLEAIDAYVQQSLIRPPRTLLVTLSSGSTGPNLSGNTTYYYKVTAFNESGETTEGKIPNVVEAQVTQPSVPLPIILQWEPVKGANGYKIYKSNLSNTEKLLAVVNGENASTFTDDGNTQTDENTSVPVINTARLSVSKINSGQGINVIPSHGRGEVQINNAGVTGIKKSDESNALTGNVLLEAGNNIVLTQDGNSNKITISGSGGGGGNFTKVTEIILSSDSASFGVISSLDLDADKCYKLITDFSFSDSATSGVKNLLINFNGSSSNYVCQLLTLGFGGSVPAANPQSTPVLTPVQVRVTNYPDSVILESLIRKDPRGRIFVLTQSTSCINTAYYPNLVFGGILWTGGTNVNSIEVKTSDGTLIKAGSRLVLYKLT